MGEWVGIGNIERLKELIYVYGQILEAYNRQEGYCIACGAGPMERFETHHVKPRKSGGMDDAVNLEVVCSKECHSKREERSIRIYRLRKRK